MKKLFSLFLLFSLFWPLSANSYNDYLDIIIDQKVAALKQSPYQVDKLVDKIRKNIKTQVSLREIESFLNNAHSVVFFFCDHMQSKSHESLADAVDQNQQIFKELQFALGAKLYLYYLACAQQKMLYKAVKNYEALHYWENEKFYESRPFFQKGILRSLSGFGYQERIESNIQQLQKITKQTDSFLGLVLHNQQLLQQATTEQEFQDNLKQAIRIQSEHLDVFNQIPDLDDMSSIIKQSIEQLSTFSVNLSEQYAQCHMPSHVVRHWKGYTMTTVAACAAAFIYLRYGKDIVQGSQHVWNEHIRGATERAWNTFIAKVEGPKLHIKKLDTTDNQKTAQLMIQEELKKPQPRGSKDGSIIGAWYQDANVVTEGAVEEACEELGDIVPMWMPGWIDRLFTSFKTQTNKIIEQGSEKFQAMQLRQRSVTMQEVSKDFLNEEQKQLALDRIRIILANPERNPFRVIPAYSLKAELEAIDLKNSINDSAAEIETVGNEFIKDGHSTLGFAALIPVITLIGGSMFASQSLYNSVAYQPIRTLVRRLEVFLNEIFYEPVTFDKEGHLYFLTEQLKLHVNVLTLQEQKLITDDIAALQAPSLDYVQKTNVVHRMYRTYPCLIPARV